jgi:hypothetical protein
VPSSDRITIPGTVGEDDGPASEARPILPRHAIPWLIVTFDDLRAMPLDPRDGFILSLVDGRSSIEMIIDLATLPEAETLTVLMRLLKVGAIELHDP